MKYTKEKIKTLTDRQIQCLEHDSEVDAIRDLSGSLYLSNLNKWAREELKKRNLKELPRLNGFN